MKVLIVDTVHDILLSKLKEKGFIVDYKPQITEKEAKNQVPEYTGIIIRSKFKIDKEFIDTGKNLRFIGRVGAGLENIDIQYASTKKIKCFNSPEGNRDAVGEHALGMILSLMNKINTAHLEVKKGIWQRGKNRGMEIKNKTVGIVGYGNMGSAFAEKLKGMSCRIIAYDKYKFGFSKEYIQEVQLAQIFDESDILSLHVPLTEETFYMVDDEFFKSFRKPIFIINTARGAVVKTEDLVKNLKNNKVLGAALDVLEFEKTSFEELHQTNQLPEYFKELTKMENVILSPHIAGWTHESNRKLSEIIANKIIAEFSS